MYLRLAADVQVRRESWGLLFYHQTRHKIFFIRSGAWLRPEHFSGGWTLEKISGDIVKRTGAPPDKVAQALPKLAERLAANRVIIHEIR